jgi:hypothetical protein
LTTTHFVNLVDNLPDKIEHHMQTMMSVADWATTLGISRQAADKAIKRLGIARENNKIDAGAATAIYQQHARPRASGNRQQPAPATPPAPRDAGRPAQEPDDDEPPPYDVSRARREAAEAARAEIEAVNLAAKYLDKADVRACVREVVEAMRAGLRDCNRRSALQVAPLATADECEAVIEREYRTFLEGMTHTLSGI